MLNLKVLSNNELENIVGGNIKTTEEPYGYRTGLKNTIKAIIPFCEPEITGRIEKGEGEGKNDTEIAFGYLETIKANFNNIEPTGKKVAVGATPAAIIATAIVGGGYLLKKYVIKK